MAASIEEGLVLALEYTDGSKQDWLLLPAMVNLTGIEGTVYLRLEGPDNQCDEYLVEFDTDECDSQTGDIQDVGKCPYFPSPRAAMEATEALRGICKSEYPGLEFKVRDVSEPPLKLDAPSAVGLKRYEVREAKEETRSKQGAVSPDVRSHCDGWWEWYSKLGKTPYDITGKYLFFSKDRDLLAQIATEELESNGFHKAKIPMVGNNRGDDYVLCLYYKDDSRKRELAGKYGEREDVRYRYWKSDEDTRAGKYSDTFLQSASLK